jgi:hypothetical protein
MNQDLFNWGGMSKAIHTRPRNSTRYLQANLYTGTHWSHWQLFPSHGFELSGAFFFPKKVVFSCASMLYMTYEAMHLVLCFFHLIIYVREGHVKHFRMIISSNIMCSDEYSSAYF